MFVRRRSAAGVLRPSCNGADSWRGGCWSNSQTEVPHLVPTSPTGHNRRRTIMKTRILIGAAAIVAAVPAIIGLWGNSSFSQDLPVRVPASGQVLILDPTPSPTPSSSDSPSPSPSPSFDDNGGDIPRDQRVEPGDDRDVQGATESTGTTDDSGHHSGSDDSGHHSGSDDSGSDDSGHHSGSDDSGSDGSSDDHGSSGHGSDD